MGLSVSVCQNSFLHYLSQFWVVSTRRRQGKEGRHRMSLGRIVWGPQIPREALRLGDGDSYSNLIASYDTRRAYAPLTGVVFSNKKNQII